MDAPGPRTTDLAVGADRREHDAGCIRGIQLPTDVGGSILPQRPTAPRLACGHVPIAGPTRGALVKNALDGELDLGDSSKYEGFNLLLGPVEAMRYHNNIEPVDAALTPGIHGLSNHFLNTPWPKVDRAKADLREALNGNERDLVDSLFGLLANAGIAPDGELPDTGLPLAQERAVSSIFISGSEYGTRCSTVVLVDREGQVQFEERTYPDNGRTVETFTLVRP